MAGSHIHGIRSQISSLSSLFSTRIIQILRDSVVEGGKAKVESTKAKSRKIEGCPSFD